MIHKWQRFIFLFFVIAFFFVISPHKAWGHSFVVKETPAPNSQLETSPKEVIITFDNRVERSLISIKLIDDRQQEVTSKPAQLSDNQQEIILELPELAGDIYRVEYYAISSNDGHPISGSYYFKVANAAASPHTDDEGNISDSSTTQQPEDEENVTEVVPSGQKDPTLNKVNLTEWIIYIMRAIYYIGLLLMIGWVFWWRYIQDYSKRLKKTYLFWGNILQMLHLVGLISMILIQLNLFTSNGLSLTSDFPMGSIFSLMWLASLFVSLVGFVCLFRNQWFDLCWILVILISKSLNGHSLEFEPTLFLVISNGIHLFAASIWGSGLLFTIVFWRRQRLYVYSFLPLFSKYAFFSIVILSITGAFITVSILSSFDQLFTNWGLFLLYKLFAVLLVVTIGGIIRSKLKKHKTVDLRIWIIIDFILMLTIIILVSILTYLNPLS